jgi:hypothetical protein
MYEYPAGIWASSSIMGASCLAAPIIITNAEISINDKNILGRQI